MSHQPKNGNLHIVKTVCRRTRGGGF